ncbi:MAG: glycerol dehydrogenase [Deltaproteobacteria bacterium]|nr:glycerol dehydrogenase [Deltaproteobacteria bacterium]
MEISTAYLPHEVFAPSDRGGLPVPRVFVAPGRYVEGRGVLRGVGHYLTLLGPTRAALLMSARGLRGDGATLLASLRDAGIEAVPRPFGGECSLQEIEAQVAALAAERVDCLVAAGGGKCIDAGKAIAFRLGVPVAIVPTLASNDAPCSALSVLYSPEGVSTGAEFYPDSPALVVVAEAALGFPFMGNMPLPISADLVCASVRDAHALGSSVAADAGDEAYRRLHG